MLGSRTSRTLCVLRALAMRCRPSHQTWVLRGQAGSNLFGLNPALAARLRFWSFTLVAQFRADIWGYRINPLSIFRLANVPLVYS